MPKTDPDVLATPCAYCGADPGEECFTPDGEPRSAHMFRKRDTWRRRGDDYYAARAEARRNSNG